MICILMVSNLICDNTIIEFSKDQVFEILMLMYNHTLNTNFIN